ncbi:MAG TPA: flagellar basal body rod protein FlgC [Fimbriimonadaceae bacterium]|nr:flagellar basal body rod protein FlgC [Fimbriimonadaceae bacterium]
MNTLSSAMRASTTGLNVERFRMDVISSNIANANSMRVGGQDPYRRRDVEVVGDINGVRITRILEDQSEFRRVYDRGNPNADAEGFVTYSNTDPLREMVSMMGATRAYEANIAAFNSAKGMIRAALNIGKAA